MTSRKIFPRAVTIGIIAIGLAIAALALFGCKTKPASHNSPSIDPKPILNGQKAKDLSVLDWAAKIDASVDAWFAMFPADFGADIKVATTGLRKAVADAPAAQFNVVIDALTGENAQLKKDNTALTTRLTDLEDAERKKQILILRGLGVFCAVAAGALIYFGQRSFAGLAGITSVILLGLAQLISQPWFSLAFNIALGLTFLSFLGVGIYEFRRKIRDKRLATAHDDVIKGVEEVRALFRNPPAELAEIVRNAATPEEAIEAVRKLGKALNAKMAEFVTEGDGTAAIIDERRRALGLLT